MQDIIKDYNLITRICNYTNWADEDYVTYETAVKLSKIHFPQYHQLYNGQEIIDVDKHPEIKAYASDEPDNLIDLNSLILYGVTEKPGITVYTAPTLNIANKWLKKIYGYSVIVEYSMTDYTISIINHKNNKNIKYSIYESNYKDIYDVKNDMNNRLSIGINIIIDKFILDKPKEKYWKPGNIIVTRRNGPAIIVNDNMACAKLGAVSNLDLDDNLLNISNINPNNNYGSSSNDVMMIFQLDNNSESYDIWDVENLKKYAILLWKR